MSCRNVSRRTISRLPGQDGPPRRETRDRPVSPVGVKPSESADTARAVERADLLGGRETEPCEGRASQGRRPEKRKRLGRCEADNSDRLARCLRDRTHDRAMGARLALPVRRKSKLFRALTRFARQDARTISAGTATEHSTLRQPVQLYSSWRTERARAGGAERSEGSRLSDPYPRGRCRERGYVAERPPAARGLSTHDVECGCGRDFVHIERAGRGRCFLSPSQSRTRPERCGDDRD